MRLVALLVALPLLAGCVTSDDSPEQLGASGIDFTQNVAANKAAIAGLLIDDRYMPVPNATLIIDPGFWVAKTDGAGQFSFVDLDPGLYSLQAGAKDHEAAEVTIKAEAGMWNDATIMARRTAGESWFPDRVYREFTLVQGCSITATVISFSCGELLLDTNDHLKQVEDYSKYGNGTVAVTEFRFDRPGNFLIDHWAVEGCNEDGYNCREEIDLYYNQTGYAKYFRTVVTVEGSPYYKPMPYREPWDGRMALATRFWTISSQDDTMIRDELPELFWGNGMEIQRHVDVVQTVFIGEPAVDIDAFCVYCDIPPGN